MKKFLSVSIVISFLFGWVVFSAAQKPAADPAWSVVGEGVEYQEFTLPGPVNVFVTRMDIHNPNVILESSIGQGKLYSGREPVSGMAARYNQAINYWGEGGTKQYWGTRNNVIAAINGIYFDWYSGVPENGQVHSGWYAKRYDDYGGYSGLAWNNDRQVAIGECVFNNPDNQFITYVDKGVTQRINGVNKSRNANQMVLYTSQFDSNTHTDDTGVEVLVEMTRPTLILPAPNKAIGYVREIRDKKGSSSIPFDHVILSAEGSSRDKMLLNAHLDQEIHFSQEISDCANAIQDGVDINWTKTYASIGGHFYFLKDGVINPYSDNPGATGRAPRTAMAYNADYIFFIVADGRDEKRSIGMTIEEVGLFARDVLSATHGVAEDGGGSSTLVVNGEVKNNTTCNNYCYYTDLPIVVKQGVNPGMPPSMASSANAFPPPSTHIERWVGNGMMMVVVEPLLLSTAYTPGEMVTATITTELRLGPGYNYASLIELPQGSHATIIPHQGGLQPSLNGVLAKNDYWWKISFGEIKGWIPESALEKLPAARFKVPHFSVP